jgi:hypothetical protein
VQYVEYFVERAFRPAVIADAARDCRIDVAMRIKQGWLEMVIRPIGRELLLEDVRAFENRLRVGQVDFKRKSNQ